MRGEKEWVRGSASGGIAGLMEEETMMMGEEAAWILCELVGRGDAGSVQEEGSANSSDAGFMEDDTIIGGVARVV